jgi:chromosomal replication initiation ATPase DnaA
MNIPRLQNFPVDTSDVQRMLNYPKISRISLSEKIKNVIKNETGIDPTQYRHYRGEELVTARFLFMVMMVRYSNESYRVIGSIVGKDHSTINHAIKEVNNRCDTDRRYRELFERVNSKIKLFALIKNEI